MRVASDVTWPRPFSYPLRLSVWTCMWWAMIEVNWIPILFLLEWHGQEYTGFLNSYNQFRRVPPICMLYSLVLEAIPNIACDRSIPKSPRERMRRIVHSVQWTYPTVQSPFMLPSHKANEWDAVEQNTTADNYTGWVIYFKPSWCRSGGKGLEWIQRVVALGDNCLKCLMVCSDSAGVTWWWCVRQHGRLGWWLRIV